jgi:hypothetical protein
MVKILLPVLGWAVFGTAIAYILLRVGSLIPC